MGRLTSAMWCIGSISSGCERLSASSDPWGCWMGSEAAAEPPSPPTLSELFSLLQIDGVAVRRYWEQRVERYAEGMDEYTPGAEGLGGLRGLRSAPRQETTGQEKEGGADKGLPSHGASEAQAEINYEAETARSKPACWGAEEFGWNGH